MENIEQRKQHASTWFRTLRDHICASFEALETEATLLTDMAAGQFVRTAWQRDGGGGGEMSVMKGRVFEKVGVNISTVHGEFSEAFRKEIPGAEADPHFWASGISLVAHMRSPLVPAVHMNTRMVVVGGQAGEPTVWFGGGSDINASHPFDQDIADFHAAFAAACDHFDPGYYPKFKQWCDDYFYIKHRHEPRGQGGIFYDYLKENWKQEFAFTQAVGNAFATIYPNLVRKHMHTHWTQEQRHTQLVKRGRYAEFNLLYDRGTRFGLMTGGNVDAILMSLPPEAIWE